MKDNVKPVAASASPVPAFPSTGIIAASNQSMPASMESTKERTGRTDSCGIAMTKRFCSTESQNPTPVPAVLNNNHHAPATSDVNDIVGKVKKRSRNSDEYYFDDSSFDWDEAIRVIDEKICTATSSSNKRNAAITINNPYHAATSGKTQSYKTNMEQNRKGSPPTVPTSSSLSASTRQQNASVFQPKHSHSNAEQIAKPNSNINRPSANNSLLPTGVSGAEGAESQAPCHQSNRSDSCNKAAAGAPPKPLIWRNQDASATYDKSNEYQNRSNSVQATTSVVSNPSTHRNTSNQSQMLPSNNSIANFFQKSTTSVHSDAKTNANTNASVGANTNHSKEDVSCSQTSFNEENQRQQPTKANTRTDISSLPKALQYSTNQVQPVEDEYRQKLVKHAELSKPLLNGWTLFSHQKQAILRALLMRRMICSLDMGLGKTLIGCVWAKAFQKVFSCKIIVICPVSLKKDWERTAQQATGLKVKQEPDKKKKTNKPKAKTQLSQQSNEQQTQDDDDPNFGNDSDDPNEIEPQTKTSSGYEGKKEGDESALMHITSWAKIPSVSKELDPYVVVCDEAHSMQSMQSARTRDTLDLVHSSRCLGVLLLTGTPMKNGKPLNLFPLLKAVRHPFGKNQRAYETHFCAGHQKNLGNGRVLWNANGSSNLDQLQKLVSSHMLHLTKEQCLKELPPRKRVFHHVAVSRRFHVQHEQALNDLAKTYDPSQVGENGEAILGAVQRVRLIGSLAKIDAAVELAKRILEDEPAVVIFTSFVQAAKAVHSRLNLSGWGGEVLTGESPPNKRQGMVDNFQHGLSPVFVCTYGVGGVGLTLTAACTVILLDRPWTPGETAQAEDRLRRIGQTKPVKSIWMSAFDLDKQMDKILEQKSQTSNAVLCEGKGTDISRARNIDPPKLSIFRLLKEIIPAQPANRSTGARSYKIAHQDGFSQSSMDSYIGSQK